MEGQGSESHLESMPPIESKTQSGLESITLTESKTLEDRIDRSLSKYLLVWVWSVLFGASTTLFYTFIASRTSENWGPLNLLLLLLIFIGLLAAIASNLALLTFLKIYLIPKFLLTTPRDADDEDEINRKSARLLRSAFTYMIFGAVVRVLMVIAELGFSSLHRF